MVSYGINYKCLCIMLAPLLNPRLKKQKELVAFMTIHVAVKSFYVSGSSCVSNVLVANITCLSHTEYLLNIKKCVSVTSSIYAPGLKGATNGSLLGLFALVISGLKSTSLAMGLSSSSLSSLILYAIP